MLRDNAAMPYGPSSLKSVIVGETGESPYVQMQSPRFYRLHCVLRLALRVGRRKEPASLRRWPRPDGISGGLNGFDRKWLVALTPARHGDRRGTSVAD
jgi:hypothetical protein